MNRCFFSTFLYIQMLTKGGYNLYIQMLTNGRYNTYNTFWAYIFIEKNFFTIHNERGVISVIN